MYTELVLVPLAFSGTNGDFSMADVFGDNIRCVIHDPVIAAGLENRLDAGLPPAKGNDEITLSDKNRTGRIVIAKGRFPEGIEGTFRTFVKKHNAKFQISMVRNFNYGPSQTVHTPAEYDAIQDD